MRNPTCKIKPTTFLSKNLQNQKHKTDGTIKPTKEINQNSTDKNADQIPGSKLLGNITEKQAEIATTNINQ